MARPSLSMRLDTERIAAQFRNLQGRHPAQWPPLPRAGLLLALFATILALGWAVHWHGLLEDLELRRDQESQLKAQHRDKLQQAVNLDALRTQKERVRQYVAQLEKQLPSRAELDALLSDINLVGVGRGAQLKLFKPGQVQVREYYAELPITVRVVGSYHDLGAFASDLANLPRIVTLGDIHVQRSQDPRSTLLTMDATAKTFRYLDPEEINAQRAADARKKAGARRK